MKNSEIKQLSLKELKERIADEQNMIVRLKLNHTVSPLDNPMKIKANRRNIARLLTELRSREIAENSKS